MLFKTHGPPVCQNILLLGLIDRTTFEMRRPEQTTPSLKRQYSFSSGRILTDTCRGKQYLGFATIHILASTEERENEGRDQERPRP